MPRVLAAMRNASTSSWPARAHPIEALLAH